jgi:hypothetical protein
MRAVNFDLHARERCLTIVCAVKRGSQYDASDLRLLCRRSPALSEEQKSPVTVYGTRLVVASVSADLIA